MKPVLDIYADRPIRMSVDSLTVSQEENKHDQFSAYLARPGDLRSRDIKGKPCKLTWGSGVGAQTMQGYVDTLSSLELSEGLTGVAVLGLGATSKLRSGQARSWKRTSPFRIARSITSPYRMGLVVDQYVQPIDAFMQTSESDWAALLRLADMVGMTVIGKDATIHLVDVRAAIGRAMLRPVPVLREPDEFIRMETPTPVGFDTYEFSGIDRLGVPFAVRGGPAGGVKRHSSQNYASLEEALSAGRRQDDRERRMSRAMAKFRGPVSVRCGDVVQVEGEYWFVANSKHESPIGSPANTTHLELQQTAERRPTTAAVALPPPPVLRDECWVGSKRYEVEL